MAYSIKTLTASEIAKATGGRLIYGNADSFVTSVSCDSRELEQGCLYIPIKGERFDGHSLFVMPAKKAYQAIYARTVR